MILFFGGGTRGLDCNYGWTMKVQLRFWNVSFLTLTDEIGFFIGDKKTENTKSSGTGIGFSKSEKCLAFRTKVLCQDKLLGLMPSFYNIPEMTLRWTYVSLL